MTEVWLGVIAVAVLVMAMVQAAAMILAVRAVRQVGDAAERLERDIGPVVANLHAASADAAAAAALAAKEVDRAGRLIDDVAGRVDDTVRLVQESIAGPFRDWSAILHGVAAGFTAFRESHRSSRERVPRAENEEAAVE